MSVLFNSPYIEIGTFVRPLALPLSLALPLPFVMAQSDSMGVTALGVRAGVEIGVVVEVWQTIRNSKIAKLVTEHNRPYSMACKSSTSMLSSMTLIDSPCNPNHLAAVKVTR